MSGKEVESPGLGKFLRDQKSSYTFVSNQSSRDIVVTVDYDFWGKGKSQFQNRLIKAGDHDGDVYTAPGVFRSDKTVTLTCEISGSGLVQTTQVPICKAIIFLDNAAGGKGVEIWLANPKEGDTSDRLLLEKKVYDIAA